MKNGARGMFLLLGDIVGLLSAFFIMLAFAFPTSIVGDMAQSHSLPFTAVSVAWILVFFIFNLYEPHSIKPTIPNLRIIGVASLTALTASAILFYIIPSFGITPKTNLLIFGGIFVCLFILWRRIFYAIFAIHFKKSVAFVIDSGDDLYVKELVAYIKNYPQSGFYISDIYSSVEEFLKNQKVKTDTLIVSRNSLKGEDLKNVYNSVRNILSLAQAYEDILGKVPVDSIDETWFLHNIREDGKIIYEVTSRTINFVVALAFIIITLPFSLITAFFIKFGDGGPIFYNRERVGQGGKNFKLYKFRSMVVDADKGMEWTEKGDPRITKVGRVVRKLHIDEAPQLLNILRGEMALVGPRPEIPGFATRLENEILHYNLRHIITPGFTGWAQIKYRNARGVAESKEKFEYDLYYIKNRNIFMDFGIILRTIVVIFTHDA